MCVLCFGNVTDFEYLVLRCERTVSYPYTSKKKKKQTKEISSAKHVRWALAVDKLTLNDTSGWVFLVPRMCSCAALRAYFPLISACNSVIKERTYIFSVEEPKTKYNAHYESQHPFHFIISNLVARYSWKRYHMSVLRLIHMVLMCQASAAHICN